MPETGGNPPLLIADTDALIQVFASGQGRLLRLLKTYYEMNVGIAEAVRDEMTRPGHSKAKQFRTDFDRALRNATIVVLSESGLSQFRSTYNRDYLEASVLGSKYSRHLGRGEAYTHAFAVTLKCPVFSNDAKALYSAQKFGLDAGTPTLRFFDLVALFLQNGVLNESDCDAIRRELAAHGEGCHRAFSKKSMGDGLQFFKCRIFDTEHKVIGCLNEQEIGDEYHLGLTKAIRK